MKVGFVGLGIMGSRMAENLVKAGHELTVFNRTKAKAEQLIKRGATWADSPTELAGQVEVVITMLSHPDAVAEAALGEEGFLQAMKQGALWLDSSTVHPHFSREMAAEAKKQSVRFLEAPVAGTKAPAEDAELIFFVGGDSGDISQASPLLEAMGKKTIHVGEHGMGTALKLVVNYMLASSMAAFAEGIAFGESLGLSEALLFNVLLGGPLVPAYLSLKRDSFEQDDYEVSFPLKWIHKDMHMITTAAYDVGTAMPIANLTKELYQFAIQAGLGDKDFSVLYQHVKRQASSV